MSLITDAAPFILAGLYPEDYSFEGIPVYIMRPGELLTFYFEAAIIYHGQVVEVGLTTLERGDIALVLEACHELICDLLEKDYQEGLKRLETLGREIRERWPQQN